MRSLATKALPLAVTLLASAAASPARAAIGFATCPRYAPLQCATFDVPLDRGGRVPGTLRLATVRRLAAASPTRTAVLALAGGPGQAATPLVDDFASLVAPALTTRDLLVLDQRGTGASSALWCSMTGLTLTGAARRCAMQLGARRGQFTTSASVEDIEALRAGAGYEQLVLFGISYGTKVALDYAARYPGRVESLVLDSVVLPRGPDTLQRSTFAASRRVLKELCDGDACRGITRRPVADLAGQVRRLRRRPLRGRLTDTAGKRRRVTIDRRDLLDIVLTGDLNPTLRAELPAALTSARRGDSSPLIRLAARSAGVVDLGIGPQAATESFSDSVFAATLCEEGVFPWNRAANRPTRARQARALLRAAGDAPFYPFDAATVLQAEIIELCIGWPTMTPPAPAAGRLPDVPALVVSGAADVRTPREDAAALARLMPSASILSLPGTGHSALAADASPDDCGRRGMRDFFAGRPVTPCAPGPGPVAPAPVAPTRLGRLPGTGSNTMVGRTITAALLTADDVRRQVIGDLLQLGRFAKRDGGLRGGSVSIRPSGRMRLRNVVYVPGVTVSGSVPFSTRGSGVLRIGGRRAAHGRISFRRGIISGRVGGRRIRITVATAAAAQRRDPSPAALLRRFRLRHAG